MADVPPPVPPAVANTYKTPYDAAYYYYGTRNPLDPNPPNYQSIVLQYYSFFIVDFIEMFFFLCLLL